MLLRAHPIRRRPPFTGDEVPRQSRPLAELSRRREPHSACRRGRAAPGMGSPSQGTSRVLVLVAPGAPPLPFPFCRYRRLPDVALPPTGRRLPPVPSTPPASVVRAFPPPREPTYSRREPHSARRRGRLLGAGQLPRPTAWTHYIAACRRLWDALLCRACAGRGDLRHVLELLFGATEEHSALLSASMYGVMVSGLCARGEVDGALRVFDVMTQRGCQVDDRVCSAIVAGFSRSRKARVGLEFYDRVRREFRGFKPGLVTLIAIVHALGLEGRIGEVAKLVQEMERKGIVGDAVFYSSLVHGYMGCGFLMAGLREHRSMLDKGIAADVVDYTNVIDALCREGNVEKLMGFLDEMEKRDAKPNFVTYTSLVDGFCKRNRMEDAFSIVKKLEQTGAVVNEYVYSILIDSLCKYGDLDKAFSLLEEMENKGIKASIVTYNAVINGLCKAGDTEKLVGIFEGVAADNFTYSTLLHGYMNRDDETGVMAIRGRLESSGISMDVVTCNVLVKALFMINKVDDACTLFHKMPEMGLGPNSITYHTVIDMMCKLENIDRALELFDEYKKDSSLSSTVVHDCLIRALCNGRKIDMADQIFYDLVQKNLRPNSCSCRKLIHAPFKERGEHGVLDFICKVGELDIELFSSVCNYASAFLNNRDCCQAPIDAYKLLRMQSIQPLLCEFIKFHGLREPRMINMLSRHLSNRSELPQRSRLLAAVDPLPPNNLWIKPQQFN